MADSLTGSSPLSPEKRLRPRLSSRHTIHNGLKKDLEAREAGRLRLGAGTPYRAIQQLLDAGLVAESDRRPVRELDDERRTYYRLTTLGREAAAAEARRLTALVGSARVRKLVKGGEPA